ncbi:uncharacterized protein C8orf48 homolog isoform X2 [Opisthocomus hoazin]|uniref:uncharacterized protein C8orf48 homolog isoform X2 n=1 Tax=Opisthocomus hoazin TaxID=30419 RepID=UPI003F532317
MSWLAGQNHADITELLDGELDALQSFCTVKISKMRQQLISKQANGGKSRKLQHGFTAKKPEREDLNCVVPDRLMNRIRLKNSRETAKQVTEAQIHEPSVCPDCQKQKAELAEVAFLRQKKSLMESALIQEKLEEQIYSRDVLTLIGEALRSFPKPSEDPRNLWQRLKDTPSLFLLCFGLHSLSLEYFEVSSSLFDARRRMPVVPWEVCKGQSDTEVAIGTESFENVILLLVAMNAAFSPYKKHRKFVPGLLSDCFYK